MAAYKIGTEGQVAYRAIVFLIAIACAFGFGTVASHQTPPGQELKAEDALARLAVKAPRADVVILALDDASVGKYGPVKSWPRSLLANGLKQVETGGAKVVVVDLALDKRTKTGDRDLWKIIANNRNVVLGMAYDAGRSAQYTPDDIRSLVFLEKYALADKLTFGVQTQAFPYYLFEPPVSDFTGSSRGVGVFDRETDPDGILRNSRLFYISKVAYPQSTAPIKGKFPQSILADGTPVALPNLTLVTAQRAFDLDKQNVEVVAGNTVRFTGQINPPVNAPVDDQGRMLIRYYGPAGHYITYSFADVVSGKVNPNVFKDKIVMVGATANGDDATDARITPMGMMPRVEITTNAVATFLDRSFLSRYPYRALGIMILIGLVTGLALMFVSGVRATIITLLLLMAYTALSYALFANGHVVMPILPAVLTILITYLAGLFLHIGPMRPTLIETPDIYVPQQRHSVNG